MVHSPAEALKIKSQQHRADDTNGRIDEHRREFGQQSTQPAARADHEPAAISLFTDAFPELKFSVRGHFAVDGLEVGAVVRERA